MWRGKGVLTFADILDNGGGNAGFFVNFPEGGLLVIFARLYGSLGKNPALVFITVVFVENK